VIGQAMRCHVLVEAGGEPGWRNMALDRALLDLATEDGGAYLRLYRWQPHCLSFGRNEPATRRYDRERIRRLGLSVVRRPTGGRAVWHARELTYAMAAPTAKFGTLKEAYQEIHGVLAEALARLGAAASLAPSPRGSAGLDAGPCFAHPAGGEIMVTKGKVVGSAQLRQGEAFLQHGSILLEDSQETVRELLLGADRAPSTRDTPLSAELGRRVSFDEVAEAIHSALAGWRGPWTAADGARTRRLRASAERYTGQFRDEAWTWSR